MALALTTLGYAARWVPLNVPTCDAAEPFTCVEGWLATAGAALALANLLYAAVYVRVLGMGDTRAVSPWAALRDNSDRISSSRAFDRATECVHGGALCGLLKFGGLISVWPDADREVTDGPSGAYHSVVAACR